MNEKQELQLLRQLESGNLSDRAELQILKALEENPDDVSDLLTATAFQDFGSGKSLRDLAKEKEEEDQDANFDYATGGDSGLRARLSFGETDEEKEAILQSLVGEEGYTKDSKGQLALTELGQKKRGIDPVGKNLVIEDKGFSFGDVADLAGILPEAVLGTAGAIFGGTAGTIVPGAGTIGGAALGGGLGSAAGQAIEEGIESLLGFQRQTGKEVAKDVAIEGAIGAGGSLIGDFIFGVGKRVVGGVGSKLSGLRSPSGQKLTSEQLQRVEYIRGKGGKPSLRAAGAPDQLDYAQKFNENASKTTTRIEANLAFVKAEKDELLKNMGATSDDAGNLVFDATQKNVKKLTQAQKQAQKEYLKSIDESIDILEKATKADIDISDEALTSITKAFNAFSKGSSDDFGVIDNILNTAGQSIKVNGKDLLDVGGVKAFDVSSLRSTVDDFLDTTGAFYKSELSQGVKQLQTLLKNQNNAASFSQLARARKNFNDILLFGPTGSQELKTLKFAIDDIIESSEIAFAKGYRGSGAQDLRNTLTAAADARRTAINNYRQGIKRFEALEKHNAVRNVRAASTTEGKEFYVDRFFEKIVVPGSPAKLNAVLRASDNPEELREMLARKFLDDAMTKSKKGYGDIKKFNGQIFANEVEKLKTTGKILFGKDKWDQVKTLATSLGRNAHKSLDEDVLNQVIRDKPIGNIVGTLSRLNQVNLEANKFLKSKVIKGISEGNVDPSDVISHLAKPSTEVADIKRIKKFFGESSQEFKEIQKSTVEDILRTVDETIFDKESSSKILLSTLNKYKRGHLAELLGKERADGLYEFAKQIELLGDVSKEGAIVAAGITANPITRWRDLVRAKLISGLMSNDAIMDKYIALQKKNLTQQADAIDAVLPTAEEAAAQIASRGPSKIRKATEQVVPRLGTGNETRTNVPNINMPPPSPSSDLSLTDMFDLIQSPRPTQAPPAPMGLIDRIRNEAQQIQQNDIRQRAARNPAIASTLLGGLGSASLLD
tara:strand:- start:761 stop:3772 length:3012 start_codon:yes stop_codon:yes gene_type:complete